MKKESRHALLIEAILKDAESQANGYGRLDESGPFNKEKTLKTIAKFFYSLFSGRFVFDKDDVSNYENEFWAEGAELDILVNYISKIFVESYLIQKTRNLRKIENTAKQFDDYYRDNEHTQMGFRPLHVLQTIRKNLEEMGESYSESSYFKSKNNPDEDVFVYSDYNTSARGASQEVNKVFASNLGQIIRIIESIGTFVDSNNALDVSTNIDELARYRGMSKSAIYMKWVSQGKANIRTFNKYKQFFKTTFMGPIKQTPAPNPAPTTTEQEPEHEPEPTVEEKPKKKGFFGGFFG